MGYLLISLIRASPLLNILPILVLSLLTQTTFSADSYLASICSRSSGMYTNGSNYEETRRLTLNNIISNILQYNGFMKFTSVVARDSTYGLALCRGDVSTDYACQNCLQNAKNEIDKRCPRIKAAIIWHDYCLLRYSDKDFFRKIDSGDVHILTNTDTKKAPDNPQGFKAAAVGLLRNLSNDARERSNMFARGEKLLDKVKNVTIYGMAQCTRDLSKGNCTSCLDAAVNKLPPPGDHLVGAAILTGSCSVRFDRDPFLIN